MPPFIVLEVMRILDAEMDLREETRGVEQAHDAVEAKEYDRRAGLLAKSQDEIRGRLEKVMVDIRALPEGSQQFGKELQIIGAAARVAQEATRILSEPDTGPEAIAAETEIIELLLQSKRANPSGGGGGGGTPGGGGEGDTDRPALALYGPGADLAAHVQQREVRQATGATADGLPAEFRAGIEAFQNAVESVQ